MKHLIILIFFTTACITMSISNKPNKRDKIIQDSITEFKELFPEIKDKNIKIEISNKKHYVTDPKTGGMRFNHGMCWPYRSRVVIESEFFKTAPYYHVKKVIFHELGHCYLYLRHPQENDFEYTIMNRILDTANKDGSNWGYLKGELRLRYLKAIKKTK